MYSMTGFSRVRNDLNDYSIVCEIKSVNHRFKDIRFRMSSSLNQTQMKLKKEIDSHFKRGSFDVYINITLNDKSKSVDLDYHKVKTFLDSFNELSLDKSNQLNINPCNFIRPEFIRDDYDESEENKKQDLILNVFKKSLVDLKNARQEEGEEIRSKLLMYITDLKKRYCDIMKESENIKDDLKEKLKKKLDEASKEFKIDEDRFNQELIYYLEKQEIQEEIDRLNIHLKKFEELMMDRNIQEKGRKLEFLTQEIHREVNTIGSKSQLSNVLDNVVEMKVLIEKLREQTLNIE